MLDGLQFGQQRQNLFEDVKLKPLQVEFKFFSPAIFFWLAKSVTNFIFLQNSSKSLVAKSVARFCLLRIQIKIAGAPDGTSRADFYVPDQGTNRQPTAVSYDGTTVKLMPMAGFGMFEGRMRNGGSEMAGNWVQGGRSTPTTLTRATYSEYQVQAKK